MKFKFKYFVICCVIYLLLKAIECYFEAQTLNSFDGALRHLYNGVSLDFEDTLLMYP